MSKNLHDTKDTRPTSPHLTIYKPQISSVLSILHRVSGVALFVILLGMVWWFSLWVFCKFNPCFLSLWDNNIVQSALVFASYGLFYHFCTGIRHLIWDMGKCLSLCAMHYTGWMAIIVSLLLTAFYWMM